MSIIKKKLFPYLLILIGIYVLLFIGQPIISGACLLIGIVMIIERIWPEKWEEKN